MGTRLREHSETRPKPMVEVGGKPILWHIMKLYASYGITDFVVALGYKGDQIRDYFLHYDLRARDATVTLGSAGNVEVHTDHGEAGWRVTLAETGEKAQTGCRTLRAARYAEGETFALTYGDGLTDVDLAAVLRFHKSHGGLVTITGVRPPGRFGELRSAVGGKVTAFAEKPQVTEGVINGGFFFIEPGFLKYLKDDDACILESHALEAAVADGQVHVYEHDGFWQCMDTPRDWEALERHWVSGHAPWKRW